MTKAEIVQIISESTGLTRKDTAVVVEGFLESISDALERNEHIEIRGFGTFKVVERAPRTGRNPRTGSAVRIAGRKAPVFKPSKELKSRINQNI